MEKFDLNIAIDEGEVEKEEKQYLEELKNDPETLSVIRSLGLSTKQVKDNLGKILAYREDRAYCKKCPGLENCKKDHPGYIFDLFLADSGYLDRRTGPCHLLARENTLCANFIYRDYSPSWKKADIISEEWQGKDRSMFLNVATAALEDNGKPFVYLTGEHASGRSYLAAVLANSYAEKDFQVAFMDVPRRISEISELYFSGRSDFDYILSALSNCRVLVLDGFGGEFVTDVVRDAFYVPLLNARKEKGPEGRLTVFVSDFRLSEIASLYAGKKGGYPKARMMASLIESNAAPIHLEKGVAAVIHR